MLGDDKVYMIAEVGINANGDLQIAKRLIDATFACGWDCVKFQKRNPEKCVPVAQRDIPKDTPWGRMTYLEYKKRMEFSEEQYDYIDGYCKEKPVAWSASVWDQDSLDFIMKYKVPFIKIPSAMLSKVDLVKAVADTGVPIIMSTGMSLVEEIDKAVVILETYAPRNFVLMHTNSTYPTPIEDLNLLTIKYLKGRYGCTIGYSGHEYGLEPTVIAVALGARVIERHITLDHNMWGTDQAASLEVHAMDLLRKRVTEAAICLGDGIKRVTESEMKIREKLRGDK
jgi:N-acetylneuraminate synthase